jgi:hypothetical protein
MNCTSNEAGRTGAQLRTGVRRSGRFGKLNPIKEEDEKQMINGHII